MDDYAEPSMAVTNPHTVVVAVHGLWNRGRELGLLRRRIGHALDLPVRQYRYASVSTSLEAAAEGLVRFVHGQAAGRVHLVGYSLGGLVILAALGRRKLPPGRVVLLGTPANGCAAGQGLSRLPLGARLVGRCIPEALACGPWVVPLDRELGVLAGNMPVGMGRLVARFTGPNDGTVAVEETALDGAERLILPVSHTGMLFSPLVAQQAAAFLASGAFTLGQTA
jgi:pimeloyl-ACP methyl ester carboxylesterase